MAVETKDKSISVSVFKYFFDYLNNKKVSKELKINEHLLDADVNLTSGDVGAIPDIAGSVDLSHIKNQGSENSGKVITIGEDGTATLGEVTPSGIGALPSSGGTMSGPINMGGQAITGLDTPTDGTQAANKNYVDGKHVPTTVTLSASGWQDGCQTVNVPGVTAGNTILVGYNPESYEAYSDAGIRCTGQGNGTLTFFCESTPTSDVSANVVILN